MKKTILITFLLLMTFFCFSEERNDTIESIITENNFNFYISGISGNNKYVSTIRIKNGYIRCFFPLINAKTEIDRKNIVIYSDVCIFNHHKLKETSRYRDWFFPKRYRITITLEDLQKLLVEKKSYSGEIMFDDVQTYPTTCQAILIENVNVRDNPSLEGRKIGRIEKGSEVTLYEQSMNMSKIDGEENYWYRVKISEGNEGWIYGAYAKIFFENGDMGMEDKHGILLSIKN